MAWDFKRQEGGFGTQIPEGAHRIRIEKADKAVSKSGNDMLVLKFEVSGFTEVIYHYIVFMADRPEITNRNLTQFFDSFKDIPEGDLDTAHWIGKVGAAMIKHEEYNGNTQAKIGRFIPAEKQEGMPNWREADGREVSPEGFMELSDHDMEDLPF